MSQNQMSEILEPLKKFYKSEVIPTRKKMDSDPELCRTLMQGLGQMGYLLPTIPEEYGRLGLSLGKGSAILEIIIKANPSLGLSIKAHSVLTAHALMHTGTPEQKKKYLPDMASGKTIGCWAVTEPSA